jgi:hypothetical protein
MIAMAKAGPRNHARSTSASMILAESSANWPISPIPRHIGRKLTRQWLEKILWGKGGSVRPYIDTRMPNFGQAQTECLSAAQ